MKLKECENIWILGLFLGGITFLAALVLAFFADLTAQPIKEAEMRQRNQALALVMAKFDNDPGTTTVSIDGITFFGGAEAGKLSGIAAEVAPKGYAGEIKMLIGLELDGTISNVLVLGHSETPGLGSNVCDRKEKKSIVTLINQEVDEAEKKLLPDNSFLDQFQGHGYGENGVVFCKYDSCSLKGQNENHASKLWQISKDGGEFDFVSGATVSCRAVIVGCENVLKVFSENREQIISELKELAEGKKR